MGRAIYGQRAGRILRGIAAAIAACILFSGAASAATDVYKLSSATDVGIAFYKLAGARPDFKKWVTLSEEYRKTRPSLRVGYADENIRRLREEYALYEPGQDFLVAKFICKIVLGAVTQPDGTVRPSFTLRYDDNETPYFPYEVGGSWISIFVNDLAGNMTRPLSAEQDARTRRLLQWQPETASKRVAVVIGIRPKTADTERPMMLNGVENWMLQGEMAYMNVLSLDGTDLLWNETAPWYVSPAEVMLEKLYRN